MNKNIIDNTDRYFQLHVSSGESDWRITSTSQAYLESAEGSASLFSPRVTHLKPLMYCAKGL
jgi:hypothetical protein